MNRVLERQDIKPSGFAGLNTKLEPADFVPESESHRLPQTLPQIAPIAPSIRTPVFTRNRPHALPPAQDTGLPFNFLVDLTLKTIFHAGRLRLWTLAEQLRLPAATVETVLMFLRNERLCEVALRDPDKPAADINFQLSASGQLRAESALKKCQYVGPAPVSLADYVARVELQSNEVQHISQISLGAALNGLVIQPRICETLGAGLNSGRPILLHGPSGSGKTFIAEHLISALAGPILVPHAIFVDGDVIQVFDPLVHHQIPSDTVANMVPRPFDAIDQRWVPCRRPVVKSGGELTLAALDLQFDVHSRFYVAPPQVKANNGLYIIDDLGRQQVSAQALMNRWIVPLDRRVDHFMLHTGKQFCLPFHLSVIFSTNLSPHDLADEAFLRRLGYKIYVGEISAQDYRDILIEACERTQIAYTEDAFEQLVYRLHAKDSRPLLASIPYDLVSMVRDRARYRNTAATLTDEAMNWAWHTYFADA